MNKALRHKIGRFLAGILLVINSAIAANAPAISSAAEIATTDYDSQAVYVYQFGYTYVEWPKITYSNNIKTINVCSFGNNSSFLNSLENVQAKVAGRLKINIVRDAELNQMASCNIAYVAHDKSDFKAIIAEAKKYPVLTVSPTKGFADEGGIVEFDFKETGNGDPTSSRGSVAFRINNNAAVESNLKIATQALDAAIGGGK